MHKLYDAQRRRVHDGHDTPAVDSSNSADANANTDADADADADTDADPDADTDALQPQTTTLHDYWTLAVPAPSSAPRVAPS